MVFPFLWMILSSFKPNSEIISIPPTFIPLEPTTGNYVSAWNKFNFALFFRNSLFISIVETGIILYTSALVGYVLSKINFKGREIIFLIILATMMIPWPVTIIPLYQEMVWFRWIGGYKSLIIPGVFNSFGIFMMRQFMNTIPNELIEASRIDGTTEIGVFHRIILPNVTAALSALGIFIFLWTWDDFLWPFLMLTEKSTYTLPVGLALFSQQYWVEYGGVLAGASIAVIPVLIVYLIFQRRFIEGITMTGIKG